MPHSTSDPYNFELKRSLKENWVSKFIYGTRSVQFWSYFECFTKYITNYNQVKWHSSSTSSKFTVAYHLSTSAGISKFSSQSCKPGQVFPVLQFWVSATILCDVSWIAFRHSDQCSNTKRVLSDRKECFMSQAIHTESINFRVSLFPWSDPNGNSTGHTDVYVKRRFL